MGLSSSKITTKPGVKFSNIKHELKPFDIILFRGGELVSDAISFVEKIFVGEGDWTHTGMVITTDIIPIKNGVPGKLYVWESTMSGKLADGINNVETGDGFFGVQIRDLEKVIDKYDKDGDTKVAWCRLLENPLNKKDDETDEEYNQRVELVKENVYKFYKDHNNTTYDYNCLNLLSAVYDKMPKWKNNTFFCSELVTAIYQVLGLIPKNIDPELMSPVEFVTSENPLFILPPITITREWK